jgi:serine/threonine protein kinase
MGEVFLAKQIGPSGFEKLLVIKRILAHHHDKSEYLNMFLSEARLVARLTHNNVIQIHEMGQIDGDYFIAMEYVRGKSLRDIIDILRQRGEQMPLCYVLELGTKLCEGLGYAHAATNIRGRPMNIIHPAVNPHTVLLSYSGDLKLIDFGIAKSEMDSVNTATGTIKGKFVYMSPEQSAADPIDSRSDIFSLGIVLYELATLANPFVRQNIVLSLEAIQRHPVDLPETKREEAKVLNTIFAKALSKNPDERHQTCFELRDELRALLRSPEIPSEENDISTYLNELFEAEIKEEDMLLAEADSATSPPASARHRSTLSPYPIDDETQDSDVTRSGRLPTGHPRPITSTPFSDHETTMSGDDRQMAARSRRQSEIHQVAKGMEHQENDDYDIAAYSSSGPDTRSERIPSEIHRWVDATYREANSTADVPTNAILAKSSPPKAQAVSAGMFQEPLGSAEDLWSSRNEETKEIRKGSISSFLLGQSADLANSDEPANTLRTPLEEFDMEREPSVSLPIYTGRWRKTMVMSAALLFCVTVALGYWLTLKFAETTKRTEKTVLNAAPERAQPKSSLLPAPDPIFAPRRSFKTLDETKLAEKPSPSKPASTGVDKPEIGPKTKGPPSLRRKDSMRVEVSPKKVRRRRGKKSRRKPSNRKNRLAEMKESQASASSALGALPEKSSKKAAPVSSGLRLGKHGTLSFRSSVAVRLSHNKVSVRNLNQTIQLKKKSGTIKLEGDQLPFIIRVEYGVTKSGISVRLDCSPWAIVKHNGIALGKTPQGPVAPGRRHRLSFLRPGQRKPIVVSLTWNPLQR